jgi:pimeloyl-ACP methyl ester carboxylesterase
MSPDGLRNAAWAEVDAQAEAFATRFSGQYLRRWFDYHQPLRLQQGVPRRLRKPYSVPVAYTDWGPADAPLLVCAGGVANSAMRFCYLAQALSRRWRVVCMDWLGRGHSGWLADDREYTLATYVEQLHQLLAHLGAASASLLGSSLGGTVAIAYAAERPQRVSRLVLNDVGPSIPKARRTRRAETLARFYVFREPAELMRRVGAAHKHDGPLSDEVRLFLAYQQTRWSEENGGRIYRHDPRALLAYQRDAQTSVDQWAAWSRVQQPVLLLHGMLSDALTLHTIGRMRRRHHGLTVAHVPHTGHTPALWSAAQAGCIGDWLAAAAPEPVEFSIP